MNLFYVPHIDNDRVILEKDESRHLVKVLRKKRGDKIVVTDGKGGKYTCRLEVDDVKKCQLVVEQKEFYPEPTPRLSVAIAPTKNNDRTEWFLEKATEVGIHAIYPMLCDRSERKTIKLERFERVLVSAMKQSLHMHIPVLHELTTFSDIVRRSNAGNKIVAHLSDASIPIQNALIKGKDTLFLIGPEGDFSNDELALAKENNFTEVSLGKFRLRTETAGIVAATLFNLQ